MAYFLFIDESGHDHHASPYEVLAGVTIEDRSVWPLLLELKKAERRAFAGQYSTKDGELKAKRLLKRKTFRHAAGHPTFSAADRARLARRCLDNSVGAGPDLLAALAQAKLAYASEVLDICHRHGCRVFASILVDPTQYGEHFLRRDYAFLFERFFYFLEDAGPDQMGVVVFDEIEKTESHILTDQMTLYFRETRTGALRSNRVIPEPFFVHSDLTTGIQLADIAAYVLSWAYRTDILLKPARTELHPYVELLRRMRYTAIRQVNGRPFELRSVKIIDSLQINRRARFDVR